MKLYGDIDLNQGQVKRTLFEHVDMFPAGPSAGQVVFKGNRVFVCTETSEPPTWIPLTNEIEIQTFEQSLESTLWEIPYSQQNNNYIVQVFDANGSAIIPEAIETSEFGIARIYFNTPTRGKAVLIHQLLTSSSQSLGGMEVLGTDGKLLPSLLPAISITDTFVIASEQEMLSLNAQVGDVAIRTDLTKTFILKGQNPSFISSWQEILSPSSPATVVHSQTADKLTTGRTIGLSGDATGSVSFDGSTDASIIASVTRAGKLSTARTIQLTGDVTGSVSFDGSTDVSINTLISGETVNILGNTNGSVSVNYELGTYITMTPVGATTLSVTNLPSTTKVHALTFEITNGGSNITWPSGITWLAGSAPVLRTSGINLVAIVTRNGGTSWLGSVS